MTDFVEKGGCCDAEISVAHRVSCCARAKGSKRNPDERSDIRVFLPLAPRRPAVPTQRPRYAARAGAVLCAHALAASTFRQPLLPHRDKATALSLIRKLNRQVSLQRTVVALSSSRWSLKLEVIHER